MFQQRCIATKAIQTAHKSKRQLEAFAFAIAITNNYPSGQLNDWNIRKIKVLCKCNAQKAKQLVSDIFKFKYATSRYRQKNGRQITDIVVRKLKHHGRSGIRFNNYDVNGQHILKIKTKNAEQEFETIKNKKEKQTFSGLIEELSSAYLFYTMKIFGKPDALPRTTSPKKRKVSEELKFQIAELARSEYVKECVRVKQKYSSGDKTKTAADIFEQASEMPISEYDFVKHLYNTTQCFGKMGLSIKYMAKCLRNLYSTRKIMRLCKKLIDRKLTKKKRNFIKFGSLKSSETIYNKAIRVRGNKFDVVSVDNEFGGRIRPNKYSKTNNLYRQMPNYFIIMDKESFWYCNYQSKLKNNKTGNAHKINKKELAEKIPFWQ